MAASGERGAPEGVATIEIAIAALELAEYLTPLMEKELGFRCFEMPCAAVEPLTTTTH